MDSHSAARRAAAERLVRAQFRALPDQLRSAVLTHPFALPETKALVSQADQIAAAAVAATAALNSPAHGPTAFQALTGGLASGGALHAALRDACAELQLAKRSSQSRVKVVNDFHAAKNTADFETLLDALSSFQFVALRLQDLADIEFLCQQGQQMKYLSDSAKDLVVILGDWARGMRDILYEAWMEHRIQLPQGMDESDRLKRSCYSNAVRCTEKSTEPDWVSLYPLPPGLAKPSDWHHYPRFRPASNDEDSDEEEDEFRVTPLMAKHLSMILRSDDFDEFFEYFSKNLPEVAKRYSGIAAWRENFLECASRIAARLEKGVQEHQYLTRCTGECFVLHSLIHFSDFGLIDAFVEYDDGDLPRCKYDLSLAELVSNFTHDAGDVMFLFKEGIDPNTTWVYTPYLHPAEWFKPNVTSGRKEAEILRFMDHVHTDRTALEERGVQVLQLSELLGKQLTPDVIPSFISSVLSHLTDVDLLRLGLCTSS